MEKGRVGLNFGGLVIDNRDVNTTEIHVEGVTIEITRTYLETVRGMVDVGHVVREGHIKLELSQDDIQYLLDNMDENNKVNIDLNACVPAGWGVVDTSSEDILSGLLTHEQWRELARIFISFLGSFQDGFDGMVSGDAFDAVMMGMIRRYIFDHYGISMNDEVWAEVYARLNSQCS